ncbi:hypothetical protein [Brucella tritici]|uniref:Uncharacterized protein n=1 Tax=Brucella tritici TaxID=94626 RepID=A0A6L3YF30_9HYPH|nr:hypothetical protein [Brucella tritici]KAB2680029.1 hypothetical protein F9L08_21770 [Brucella tritici]
MITKQFLKETADEIDAGIAGSAFILLLVIAIGVFVYTALHLLTSLQAGDIVFWGGFFGVFYISIFTFQTASERIQHAAIPAVLPVSILAFVANALYYFDIATELVATFSIFVFGFVVIGSVTSSLMKYFSRESDVCNDFQGENIILEGEE